MPEWQGTNAPSIFLMAKIQNHYGGPGGIRTPEVVDKGFTVLPIWPLWNRPEKNYESINARITNPGGLC